jgi:hydroxyethylthiazole kinase-like uncharacterized protein yjeF
MRPVYSVLELRVAEHAAQIELGPDTLMQRASFSLSLDISRILADGTGRVAGLCVVGLIGAGNNGSETLRTLVLLAKRGVGIRAIDVTRNRQRDYTDQLFEESGGIWWTLAELSQSSRTVAMIVDGIAGLGNSRPVDAEVVAIVARLRASGVIVVATDMPTGVVVDSGEIIDSNGVIQADYTITFGALKPCHVLDPAALVCGRVWLNGIGIEKYFGSAEMFFNEADDTARVFSEPKIDDNKYTRGVVGVIAGSQEYRGAGVLAARAARWGGAGLVRHVGTDVPADLDAPSVISGSTFAATSQDNRITAWVIGPGIGLGESQNQLISEALKLSMPLVIDADAITAIARSKELMHQLRQRHQHHFITVLTPHWGEARVLAEGLDVTLSESAPQAALGLSGATSCVVYLKGSIGVIATPNGKVVLSDRMSPHLSTAGSGDVLAGLIASVFAHHRPQTDFDAARLLAAALHVHSAAAENIASDGEPVVAEAIEKRIPAAIAQFRELVSLDNE